MNILVGHYRTTKPHTLRIKRYRIQSNTKKNLIVTGQKFNSHFIGFFFPKKTKSNEKQTKQKLNHTQALADFLKLKKKSNFENNSSKLKSSTEGYYLSC